MASAENAKESTVVTVDMTDQSEFPPLAGERGDTNALGRLNIAPRGGVKLITLHVSLGGGRGDASFHHGLHLPPLQTGCVRIVLRDGMEGGICFSGRLLWDGLRRSRGRQRGTKRSIHP